MHFSAAVPNVFSCESLLWSCRTCLNTLWGRSNNVGVCDLDDLMITDKRT
jgi:hypothetical protein